MVPIILEVIMKEIYEEPKLEVFLFGSEDIITTSGEVSTDPETGVDEDGIWNW